MVDKTLLVSFLTGAALHAAVAGGEVTLPAGPNSWVFDASGACVPSRMITDDGIRNWADASQRIRTYFWVDKAGPLDLRLNASVASGASRIRLSLGQASKELSLSNAAQEALAAGTFHVAKPGYQALEIGRASCRERV